jgi:hypothetical protein
MGDPAAAVAQLKAACDRAYDNNLHSCSNAVYDLIKELVNPGETYRQANEFIDYWDENWKSVSLEEGFGLANRGIVVVGGLKVLGGHGHVIAIYPGTKIPNGGYQYFYKPANKYLTLKPTGTYPRALSTSISTTWPGTMSKGDKTVWDPWAKDDAFSNVEFWAPPASF